MVGYCRIWVPNFGLVAKLLYEALKGPEYSPLELTKECSQGFCVLEGASGFCTGLGASEPTKAHPPFFWLLFFAHSIILHERQGIALGVLTQMLSDVLQPLHTCQRN